ncbi:DUF167 domain-containing protein [Thermospira aquatica]|uniref:UPF0235 protein KDW03_06285 n=1 Tax=Thermospira aquatica TaxID=2828656 RepID=A0AAX3BA36_9SPIR|nr:DUF167 domain-containing protein [Thermospira aquatica]URA09113.1 DUF167 domain-containing protein [Thermospira aquatica]
MANISIIVVPRSSREGVFLEEERIKVCVHTPPVEGEANAAVRKVLAETLGIARSSITIVRGEKSRQKIIAIEEWDEQKLKTWIREKTKKP